jgi:hypothetical protein
MDDRKGMNRTHTDTAFTACTGVIVNRQIAVVEEDRVRGANSNTRAAGVTEIVIYGDMTRSNVVVELALSNHLVLQPEPYAEPGEPSAQQKYHITIIIRIVSESGITFIIESKRPVKDRAL